MQALSDYSAAPSQKFNIFTVVTPAVPCCIVQLRPGMIGVFTGLPHWIPILVLVGDNTPGSGLQWL